MNFDHERIVQQRRRRHQNEIRSPESNWRYAMAARLRSAPFDRARRMSAQGQVEERTRTIPSRP